MNLNLDDLNLNGLAGLTLRLGGITLSKKQVEAAWPHVQAHHDGRLTMSQMMARVRSACIKAGAPLPVEDDEDEVV